MGDGNDETGGDGRREWPADHRVAFAELLVEFKNLEGHVNTTHAKTETVFERVEASISQLGKEAAERDAKAAEAAAEHAVRAAEAAAEHAVRAAEAAAERDVKAAEAARQAAEAAAERDVRAAEAARQAAEAAAERESRLVKWVVAVVAVATTILAAGIAFLALFGIGAGN